MMEEITKQVWDVIIVGTGMGGATVGYALAKAGKRVLFCEKGKSDRSSTRLKGCYAEEYLHSADPLHTNQTSIFKDAGREWAEIEDRTNSRVKIHTPFIGAGSGGSTSLYGMALERFFPEDFMPRRYHPTATDSSLPDAWPITYQELAPFYDDAEKLYRVRGGADPLRNKHFVPGYQESPPLTHGGRELFEYLQKHGQHPYRLPLACEFKDDCECCQGYLCPKQCKNDSNRICLTPALEQFGAQLLEECQVIRLETTETKVTSVVCRQGDQTLSLRGGIVVLAAGALHTPAILLNSTSTSWPQGLANRSGLVGRNLMRHYVDLYLLKLKSPIGPDNRFKELAFNDHYLTSHGKLGSVQSFGALPPPALLAASIGNDLHQNPLPFVENLYRLVQPLVREYFAKMLPQRLILASLVEDLPYADNRIEVAKGTGRLSLHYHICPSEKERIEQMRAEMRRLLKPYSPLLIRQAENNERLAHACGTCRFGADPASSVLNVNNQAHGVDNLYVLDASFFPSSAGTNPSLTIAANALRIAKLLT